MNQLLKKLARSIAIITIPILVHNVDCQVAGKGPSTSTAVNEVILSNKAPETVKITFDEKDPAIMIVESNGEKFRVNSVTKQIERVAASASPTQSASPVAAVQQDEPKEDFYAYEPGDEPFDYRLVNVPTPKKVPKGTWNMTFSHRFSQPLQPFRESGPGLLGLDSMSVSSFGISYGITDKFYVQASRSPLCQKGLCRTIELGVGYHITDQNKHSPVALSTFASVEGNDNFTEEYTYNLQLMLSRQFGKRVFAFFSPALHLNSNGQRRFNPRPDDYFPAATVANTFKLPTHGASFGMGATVRITPSVMGIFEFTPRTGFKLGKVDPIFDPNFNVVGFKNISEPEMGVGVQYSIGKHSFTLTLSNTQTTTTSKYNSSNRVLSPRHLIIGFNLFRRW
ncbi:MAG: DUF5777 family beta-barrel protein [Pyrinomonadaceae bacterium]